MLDVEGNVATWNRGAERIKGYRADEIIGRHFSNFYPREDIDAGKPARELVDAARFGRIEDEGWRLRKDGSRFWALVVITALRDDNGELTGFAKVTRDLTDRRVIEEELRRSEERFRLLVETVADYAIYMLDPTGRVTTWNLGAERMKGYAASEIVGQSFEVFFPAEDRRAGKPEKELAAALAAGRFEDEGWRVRKDGSRFWANVIVTSIRGDHGEHLGFSKVTRDLTVRRAAEETARNLLRVQTAREAAEKLAAQMAEANRVKDEFLATVSHELRTPLNAIVGWAKMLRQRALDPMVSRGIEIIDRNADAQVQLIEDILDVSRIITGKMRIEPRSMDLRKIVNEAIDVIRPSAAAKRIRLVLDESDEPCIMVGDPERLRQVAWNLLSNAVKFTAHDGTITTHVGREGSGVAFWVSDTGRGIEPSFLPYVFDRFKQEEGSTTRRYGGLGLGLALVRHIVELHGGTVAVESELNRGSKFTVFLPVRVLSAAEALEAQAPISAETPPSAGLLRGLRVLVVDDEADARDLLATLLEAASAEVVLAASAGEAFELLLRTRPHILVSDIGMPEQDGYFLMRRIRELNPEDGGSIPSIALTAYTRGEDRTKALAAGFTTHVGKPVPPDDLVRAVKNLAPFVHR